MREVVQGLRQFIGSVRGRFLSIFLLGMMLTLAAASFLSYNSMYNAISRLNQKSACAEIYQIQTNLIGLANELERQMSMLLLDSATQTLSNESFFTQLELVDNARKYSDKASGIMMNFPYVQSVYLYTKDGAYWASTLKNMRHYRESYDPVPCEKIQNLINNASWSLSMVSGISSEDFPLPQSVKTPTPLVSVAKKHGSYVLICNIFEHEIDKTYTGIASNPESRIRFLTTEGVVFMSADKSELLTSYPYFSDMSTGGSGNLAVARGSKQIFWQAVPMLNLIIVNELQLEAYWHEWKVIRQVVFQTFFIGLSVTCLLFFLWVSRVFKPLNKLILSMGQAGRGIYSPLYEQKGRDELSSLITHYNKMLAEMQELEAEKHRVEMQKRDSELRALRNQINPHFLYNTLNTIKWMSLMDGNNKVAACITSLGKIIAPLFKSNCPTCTLCEEVKIVEEYMEIMNIRYGQGINLEIQIEPKTAELLVLRFILQPLVENAIEHGLAAKDYNGNVYIRAWEAAECLVLEISDDGKGMTADAIAKDNLSLKNGNDTQGIGMINTNRRIQLWYGSSYGITLYPSPLGGLCVSARFPAEHADNLKKVDK